MTKTISRRALLKRSALIPLATLPFVALPSISGCSSKGASCIDPEMLSSGEKHMRKTRAYVDQSSDQEQQCRSCDFFHQTTSSEQARDCGHCEILDGAVSRHGYCNAWAAKSGAA